jgi:hypothetical protein
MQDLLQLILSCLGFSNFLLLLDRDLARPRCVSLVLAIEKGRTISWANYCTSLRRSFSPLRLSELVVCNKFAACPKTVRCGDCSSIVGPFIVGIGIVDCPDMPRMKSSSEAPSHFRIPICFLPSLVQIIISPDVLIHLLKEVLQGFMVSSLQNIRMWVLAEAP